MHYKHNVDADFLVSPKRFASWLTYMMRYLNLHYSNLQFGLSDNIDSADVIFTSINHEITFYLSHLHT